MPQTSRDKASKSELLRRLIEKRNERNLNLVIAHGKIAESVSDSRYVTLSESLGAKGYLLMFDLSVKHILSPKFWFHSRRKRILFLVEPIAVFPHQYWPIWGLVFGARFSRYSESSRWDPGYVREIELRNLGALWGGSRITAPGCVISNQLKFTPGANYGLRREILKVLHDSRWGLALAGRGWDRGDSRASIVKELVYTLSAFRFPMVSIALIYFRRPRISNEHPTGAVVESANKFLANYETAIVIENETDTYCSEKLADAIMAGCKIVYIGGELQDDFKFAYPIEAIKSKDQVLGAMQRLEERELPDKNNQVLIDCAISQLDFMSISEMVTRTKSLLANRA